MLVSAIVAVRNGEAYLGECLESLINQELTSEICLEISVFDDGSTDGTGVIIEDFRDKCRAKGIAFVSSRGDVSKGVGYAKNRAVYQSHGEILVFCDADDIFNKFRILKQSQALQKALKPELTLVGANFKRIPQNSTERYALWANGIDGFQLYTQIFTSHGPTLVAPTWCMTRKLFDHVGGFYEKQPKGYPEDLRFLYDAINLGIEFVKVRDELVMYRFHDQCASLAVQEQTIWEMRMTAFEECVLSRWETFMIWGAGKRGKRFYKSLNEPNRAKVSAFCDVDKRKLTYGRYEQFDALTHVVVAVVPVIPLSLMVPPVVVCLKMDSINDNFFVETVRMMRLKEGVDYYYIG